MTAGVLDLAEDPGAGRSYASGAATPELFALAEAIRELSAPPTPESVEELLWLTSRLDARVSETLRAFDATETWRDDGSLSFTAWVAAHGRRSQPAAHREVVTARRLAPLPVTRAAWAQGALSNAQVSAVVVNLSSKTAPLFADFEQDLVPELSELSVSETAAVMRSWRLHAEALSDDPEPPERPSELYVSQTIDGRRELAGHLSPDDAAVLEAAMGFADPGPVGADGAISAASVRRAGALVEICRFFLANNEVADGSVRNRPQVSVVVGYGELLAGLPGRLLDGTALRSSSIEGLSCDSELHRILMSGRSTVLDYGSATRTISNAIWASLVTRDQHCRHPGCDRPPSWCEAHHVVHFSKGGPTKLSNLVLACTRHHHLWHNDGWELSLGGDGALTLVAPNGSVLTSRPPPAQLFL